MIDRTSLVRHLEPWKDKLPPGLLHSTIAAAETDPGVKQVLFLHREMWIREDDQPTVHLCQECRTPWPCRTAEALGVRW